MNRISRMGARMYAPAVVIAVGGFATAEVVTRTERSIELLKERRSALITAAVTGQIDLRETA